MIPSLFHCLCKATRWRLLSTAAVMSELRLRLVSPSAEMSSGPSFSPLTVSVQQPRAKGDAVINGSIHPVPPSTATKFPLLRNEQHLVRSINAWHDRSESNKRIVGMIGFRWHVFRSQIDQYAKTNGLSFLESAEPSYMESLIY